VYLHPSEAETFFVDYDQVARNAAAMLRMEVGRNPHDEELIALVGELSTCSELPAAVGISGRAGARIREQACEPSGGGPARFEL
jgi:hypothetical protein